MRFDRKGDIGFMEAMAGAMTVVVAMLAFTAFVAADISETDSDTGFDWTCIGDITASDGAYRVGQGTDLQVFCETSGLQGVSVTVFGGDLETYHATVGTSSDVIHSERRMLSVSADDGRCIPTVVEVLLYS